eukprot:TRINITY_DN74911_c0_g1_i1.p1 TRINITY_DN74911_c0_g1~~TRINITY_DN74911_c0_g1_i1.p1  ORF type:complete len:473 (-),score=119.24 TRINITY_DN74911_c0_g1_i1:519-1937(-)
MAPRRSGSGQGQGLAQAKAKGKAKAPPVLAGQQNLKQFFGAAPKAGDATTAATAAAAAVVLPLAPSGAPDRPSAAGFEPNAALATPKRRRLSREDSAASAASAESAPATSRLHSAGIVLKSEAAGSGEKKPPEAAKPPRFVGTSAARGSRCITRSKRFSEPTDDAKSSYSNLYIARLERSRPLVLAEARCLWSASVAAESFLPGLGGYRRMSQGGDVVIVGVVVKDMKARPNVVKHYRDHGTKASALPLQDEGSEKSYCSAGDVVFLEDAAMRLQVLLPRRVVQRLPTGVVVAVRGRSTEDGTKFKAEGLCMAKPAGPSPVTLPLSLPSAAGQGADAYIAFVSGPFLPSADGGVTDTAAIEAQRWALSFLLGRCEKRQDAELAAAVVRLVICGGALRRADDALLQAGNETRLKHLASMDESLAALAQALPVDIMPGPDDPSELRLPQPPLQGCFFKKAGGFASAGAWRAAHR